MNVLHLNKHEETGGAAIAAKRLHEGLLGAGINSEMLVERRSTDSKYVTSRSRIPFGVTSVARFLLDNLYCCFADGFSTGAIPSRASRTVERRQPDITHLHWVADGFLSLEDIGELTSPIVWTLHDMWAFTGGCHYSNGCRRYESSCGCCPVLESDLERDLSAKILRRKVDLWDPTEFHLVAPSQWIADRASRSTILSDAEITVIPNGVDTDRYRPVPSDNVPFDRDSKTVLFGADFASTDPRKGYDLLVDALDELSDPDEFTCVVFGDEDADCGGVDVRTESVGYLPEDELIRLYSSSDVMVVPSRYESFGQTALEALSCGTPVVAFDSTGPRDIVRHKETGYLAEPYSSSDLLKGIKWVTNSDERRRSLSEEARRDAVKRFDISRTTEKYVRFYESIV